MNTSFTPTLCAIGTALPSPTYSTDEVRNATSEWLRDSPHDAVKISRLLDRASTATHHYIQSPTAVIAERGLQERARVFLEQAPQLAHKASKSAFSALDRDIGEIDTLISCSCSIPLIPSYDTELMRMLGLGSKTHRIPLFQHGCGAGVIALALAARLATPHRPVLINATELCSLVFQPRSRDAAQLVGAAIFGDGSASAIVSCDSPSGLQILASQSCLLENTRALMGYDLRDDGFHLRLHRELPMQLLSHAPGVISQFLADNGLSHADIPWWIFHPGGVKILDALEAAFELRPSQCEWSREVLREVGNLSSASIFYVLDRFQRAKVAKPRENAIVVGIGPGLTIELVLLTVR